MTPAEILAKVRQLTVESKAIGVQQAGEMHLYSAACQTGDTAKAAHHRLKCIELYEKMLDNMGTSAMLVRQLGGNIKPG